MQVRVNSSCFDRLSTNGAAGRDEGFTISGQCRRLTRTSRVTAKQRRTLDPAFYSRVSKYATRSAAS